MINRNFNKDDEDKKKADFQERKIIDKKIEKKKKGNVKTRKKK